MSYDYGKSCSDTSAYITEGLVANNYYLDESPGCSTGIVALYGEFHDTCRPSGSPIDFLNGADCDDASGGFNPNYGTCMFGNCVEAPACVGDAEVCGIGDICCGESSCWEGRCCPTGQIYYALQGECKDSGVSSCNPIGGVDWLNFNACCEDVIEVNGEFYADWKPLIVLAD